MNNDIKTILDQINILYNRKTNLEQLMLLLNGNVQKEENLFSEDGKVITNIKLALHGIDLDLGKIPIYMEGNVQHALNGVIQDSAEFDIYSNSKSILKIKEGESSFNPTIRSDKKILHTHSFRLFGDPKNESDRLKVINNIEKSYYNAIVKFNEGKKNLDLDDKERLNLVPVSASIYAGNFAINKSTAPFYYGGDHLHPSYTLVALIKAIDKAKKNNIEILDLRIYYSDRNVGDNAHEILQYILNWQVKMKSDL